MVVVVEWVLLCVALPVAVALAALAIMVEGLYYGLFVSVVVSGCVGYFAWKQGPQLRRLDPGERTVGQAMALAGKATTAYALALTAAVIADWVCWHLQFSVTWLASSVAAAGVYFGARMFLLGDSRRGVSRFKRGRKLIAYAEALKRVAKMRPLADPGIAWGGLQLPSEMGVSHFCVTGATGSGKTVTLRLTMQSALRAIGRRADTRALVYDAKCDIVSLLSGMDLACDVRILNPFDARSWAWDMGKDVTSPATALQVASILVPPEEGANRFFSDAAQHLLAGVIISFIRSSRPWTLRDVLLAIERSESLRATLERDPHTKGLIAKYFTDERLLANILSTLAAKTMFYEPIAAVWDQAARAGRTLSLAEWVKGDFILVLGNVETIRAPMDAINRVLFRRLSELLLDSSESSCRRSWVFLDELAKAGKLDGLDSLLTKGRSKGVCVVLGFQDIESLRDPHLYGEKGANALMAECANKSFLRLDSEQTARWASGLFGETEAYEQRVSDTSAEDGRESQTASEELFSRPAVLPSEFLSLPLPSASCLQGYHLIPSVGAYKAHYQFEHLLAKRGEQPDFIPRPIDEQYLAPWSPLDSDRLGFALQADRTPEEEQARRRKAPLIPLWEIRRMTRDQ